VSRPALRVVASSSERPGDTFPLAHVSDTSSSSTRRLAALMRGVRVRIHLGNVALGVVLGVATFLVLLILGAVE
jgi:hypothetical protein